MKEALDALQDRLAPAEEIFFTWLTRVFVAATLVGSAWIDDAPPLEIAATLIGIYVAVRVATQFDRLATAAPFQNRALQMIFAVGALMVLGLSFLVIVTLVERAGPFGGRLRRNGVAITLPERLKHALTGDQRRIVDPRSRPRPTPLRCVPGRSRHLDQPVRGAARGAGGPRVPKRVRPPRRPRTKEHRHESDSRTTGWIRLRGAGVEPGRGPRDPARSGDSSPFGGLERTHCPGFLCRPHPGAGLAGSGRGSPPGICGADGRQGRGPFRRAPGRGPRERGQGWASPSRRWPTNSISISSS